MAEAMKGVSDGEADDLAALEVELHGREGRLVELVREWGDHCEALAAAKSAANTARDERDRANHVGDDDAARAATARLRQATGLPEKVRPRLREMVAALEAVKAEEVATAAAQCAVLKAADAAIAAAVAWRNRVCLLLGGGRGVSVQCSALCAEVMRAAQL